MGAIFSVGLQEKTNAIEVWGLTDIYSLARSGGITLSAKTFLLL